MALTGLVVDGVSLIDSMVGLDRILSGPFV